MISDTSPLFSPAVWEGDCFRILDETLLPEKVEYVTVSRLEEAIRAVKEMRTRAYGQVLAFLYSVALEARKHRLRVDDSETYGASLMRLAGHFTAARPTFGFEAIAELLLQRCQGFPGASAAPAWVEDKVQQFVREIDHARKYRCQTAADLLPDPCRLLTHCNISGELVAVANYCSEAGKSVGILATETRPYFQGSRLTAWELARAGAQVSLIPDNGVAQVMEAGEVNAVLVGADRVARNGDVINKVGTYPIALLAREYGIPVYALVQDPGSLPNGDAVDIEQRPVAELFSGSPVDLRGLEGTYPVFDVTPARFFSYLVGFEGASTPEGFAARHGGAEPATDHGKAKQTFLFLFGIPDRAGYDRVEQSLRCGAATGVLVTEMRPGLDGVMIAQELVRRGVPTNLICDNMAGWFFYSGAVERLFLFYEGHDGDRVSAQSGALFAAKLARAHNVPVELVRAGSRAGEPLDRDVSSFLGKKISPRGVPVYPLRRDWLSVT